MVILNSIDNRIELSIKSYGYNFIKRSLISTPLLIIIAFISQPVTDLPQLVVISDGKTIPAHSNLGIGVYQMGRDENIFEDPLKFNPERFESSTLDPFAFIAWSHGPRDCIGKKFSILEIKTVLVMILLNFELFDANFEALVVSQVILRSINGLQIGMRRRKLSTGQQSFN